MATLKVMCARSMHVAVGGLATAFARESGHEPLLDFGTVGGLQEKLDRGETADVLVLSVPMIDRMEAAGAIVPGSRRNVARTYIAVCVREGAVAPDIATPAAFEAALRAAPVVAVSDPGVGGSAGLYLEKLFERMGLAATMKEKGRPQKTGAEVARRVAEGEAALGLTLSGEIAGVPGVVIAGPLPPPLGNETVYCAAVWSGSTSPDAAGAFIAALTAETARSVWRTAGFEVD
jgi:molybdate transport system substrate-binding protein